MLHQAPGQYLGYSMQANRMLVHLLRSTPGAWVSLETIDDVATSGPNGSTIEQVKSGLSHNPVADRSVGLWKTLRNWLEAIRCGALPLGTRFVLYVLQPYTDELVQMIHCADDTVSAVNTVQHMREHFDPNGVADSIKPYVSVVLSAEDSTLIPFVKSIHLETGTGLPSEEPRALILNKAVSKSRVEDVLRYLLGWVEEVITDQIASGKLAIISYDSFHDQLVSAVRVLDRPDALVPVEVKITRNQVDEHLKDRMFVEQMKIVRLEAPAILEDAVVDYLKAVAGRTTWAERGEVLEPSFAEYSRELQRQWEILRIGTEAQMRGHGSADRGRVLWSRCMEREQKLQGMSTPQFFTRGSYHVLADCMEIGWHPDYEILLPSPLHRLGAP